MWLVLVSTLMGGDPRCLQQGWIRPFVEEFSHETARFVPFDLLTRSTVLGANSMRSELEFDADVFPLVSHAVANRLLSTKGRRTVQGAFGGKARVDGAAGVTALRDAVTSLVQSGVSHGLLPVGQQNHVRQIALAEAHNTLGSAVVGDQLLETAVARADEVAHEVVTTQTRTRRLRRHAPSAGAAAAVAASELSEEGIFFQVE
jgi:hypothetical protein